MYEVASAPRLIARNTAVSIAGRVVFLALSLLNFKLIATYLGPSLFGDWGNVFNYTALFTVLTDCGLFTVAVREIAKNPARRQVIMENVLSLRIILALSATVVAVVVAFLVARFYPASHYGPLLPAIGVGAVAMLIYFMSNMLDVVFHIELKMHFVALVELIGKVAAVVAVIAVRWLDAGFLWIVASVAIGNLAGLAARYLTARRFFRPRLRFDWPTWRWLLGLALPLGLVFALNNLYFKVDGLMLYIMKGSYDNGIYTAAYRVLETTVFASAFFVQALTPYLANYLSTRPAEARRLVNTGAEILLAMGGILAVAIFFYAPEIIVLLSGSEFSPAAMPLLLIAGVATLMYLNTLFGQVLVLLDVRLTLLLVSAATLIFNIGLNFWLIPSFSYIGAAAATLLSELILLGVNFVILRSRRLYEPTTGPVVRILFTLSLAVLGFSVARSLNLPWILVFLTIPALYFLLLWRQRVFPLEWLLSRPAATPNEANLTDH